jgi:hypothetical protein
MDTLDLHVITTICAILLPMLDIQLLKKFKMLHVSQI